jgi:hypothetical protein
MPIREVPAKFLIAFSVAVKQRNLGRGDGERPGVRRPFSWTMVRVFHHWTRC